MCATILYEIFSRDIFQGTFWKHSNLQEGDMFNFFLFTNLLRFYWFRTFGEESSNELLVFYLFLGFSGFLLLILLISITCVTLAQDDTLVLINNQEEESDYCNDIDEAKDDLTDIEKNKNIFYQKLTFQKQVLLKIKQFKTQSFKSLP